MFGVADLGGYLRGTWRLERTLVDRATGERGRVRGSVEYVLDAGGALVQHESGELAWGGHRGPAYRVLRLEPTADPGVWRVLFDDGRPFHPLDLRRGAATVEHACGPDLYVGEFRIRSADVWTYCWSVTGPAKSLQLDSVLTREPRSG